MLRTTQTIVCFCTNVESIFRSTVGSQSVLKVTRTRVSRLTSPSQKKPRNTPQCCSTLISQCNWYAKIENGFPCRNSSKFDGGTSASSAFSCLLQRRVAGQLRVFIVRVREWEPGDHLAGGSGHPWGIPVLLSPWQLQPGFPGICFAMEGHSPVCLGVGADLHWGLGSVVLLLLRGDCTLTTPFRHGHCKRRGNVRGGHYLHVVCNHSWDNASRQVDSIPSWSQTIKICTTACPTWSRSFFVACAELSTDKSCGFFPLRDFLFHLHGVFVMHAGLLVAVAAFTGCNKLFLALTCCMCCTTFSKVGGVLSCLGLKEVFPLNSFEPFNFEKIMAGNWILSVFGDKSAKKWVWMFRNATEVRHVWFCINNFLFPKMVWKSPFSLNWERFFTDKQGVGQICGGETRDVASSGIRWPGEVVQTGDTPECQHQTVRERNFPHQNHHATVVLRFQRAPGYFETFGKLGRQ